jgi:hypothetical protein
MRRSKKDAPLKRTSARTKTKSAKAVQSKAPKKDANRAGKSRAEGIRLFALAGRPSKDDFVRVFGPSGPKMTWAQRSKAGIPAEKFQAALAAKQSGRKDAKASIPALTATD